MTSRRGIGFENMVLGLLLIGIFMAACLMPAQSDSYWHLRAGQDIWRTHHISFVEAYSHTAAGSFWPNHEWLWQAFAYALYHLSGMPLLVGAAAAIVTTAFGLTYRLMVGAPTTRLVLMLIGVPLCACLWELRPQVVSLTLLVLMVSLLASERTRWLPLLFVLWANVHGAVALGGAVLAGTAGLSLVAARDGAPEQRRRALRLGALTLVCGVSTALTPLGTRLWTFIGESMTRSREASIIEWLPAYPRGPIEIAFLAVALAFIILLALRWRKLDGWSDRVVVVAAVVMLPLALRAVRNIPPFILLAMPAASRLLGADFRATRPAPTPTIDHPRLNLGVLLGFAAAAIGVIAFAWSQPLPILRWEPLPPGVVAALRACPGPLYNRYGDGGFVIWFAPEKPVFVDSRLDPYAAAFVVESARAEETGQVDALIARYGVRCALLPPGSPTRTRLAGAGWRPTYSDEAWTVLEPGAR